MQTFALDQLVLSGLTLALPAGHKNDQSDRGKERKRKKNQIEESIHTENVILSDDLKHDE